MNRLLLFVLPLAVFFVLGCDNNPGKDKPQAAVSSAQPLAPQNPNRGALTYSLSQDNSKVEFVGAKITGKHNGSFGKFSGAIQLSGSNLEEARVTVDIDMSSTSSDNDKLTGHLQSADFFDVAKYPKSTFASTLVKAAGGQNTYTITGNLTMKGVTKSITFPATIKLSGDSLEATAEFSINRKDWGIVYPGKPDDLIKDEVLLKLTLHSNKPRS